MHDHRIDTWLDRTSALAMTSVRMAIVRDRIDAIRICEQNFRSFGDGCHSNQASQAHNI